MRLPCDVRTILGLTANTDVTAAVQGDTPFGTTLRLAVDPDDTGSGPFRLEAGVTFRTEVKDVSMNR